MNEYNNEKWKKVKQYPNYEISDNGRVKSILRSIIMKQNKVATYFAVGLTNKNGYKTFRTHRLVAEYFVKGKSNINNVVNHIDGNKENNKFDNLEWTTSGKNQEHAYRLNLRVPYFLGKKGKDNPSSKPIYQYDLNFNFIRKWDSMADASRHIGIASTNILDSCKKGWSCGNYKWSKTLIQK